ncbi:uncharacterized protein MONBRDRAFT_14082 [Monosiga brevicollis MX1]|uniref:Rab-GAP TBC domain-containing protein n=1 Tax=Monosiga brevicollis TaxID=81824 RepID=A9UQG1_MONBE|nr:uncharacterized protein MONBRDRAFT_14082 [Monosiga brevicollis MX1]EDQ93039.1 predicted protein [Monosiga brevicollis MX1]|eukprot:XP_001742801.1 hypothetical protein [Monosiga brevicollis MX1]
MAEDGLDASHAIIDQWADVCVHLETWQKKRPKQLANLVYAGVPEHLRCIVWQKFAEVHAKQATGVSTEGAIPADLVQDGTDTGTAPSYAELLARDSSFDKLIRLDIARTFPEHEMFASNEGLGQEVLYNVVKAYSIYDNVVGYCQGIPFLVGLLLMHMPEEEAFQLLVVIVRDYGLKGLFKPTMADLPLRLYQLETLLRHAYPRVMAHFDDLDVSCNMFATQWFMTLFSSTMPLKLSFRIFDLFLHEGVDAIFRVALAIIGQSQRDLLRENFEGVMGLLSRDKLFKRYENNGHSLMMAAKSVVLNLKRLQKAERDYLAAQRQEEQLQREVDEWRSKCHELTAENESLRDKVASLEEAYHVLATKNLDISIRLASSTDALESAQSEVSVHELYTCKRLLCAAPHHYRAWLLQP